MTTATVPAGKIAFVVCIRTSKGRQATHSFGGMAHATFGKIRFDKDESYIFETIEADSSWAAMLEGDKRGQAMYAAPDSLRVQADMAAGYPHWSDGERFATPEEMDLARKMQGVTR